jgi:hypothetical protein
VGRDTEGTDKCHRSSSKALTPLRKGRAAEEESKNEQIRGIGGDGMTVRSNEGRHSKERVS